MTTRRRPSRERGISLGFYVADMEQTLALLQENQVEIVSGPHLMKNGVKLLNARDINGVDLGFVQSPESRIFRVSNIAQGKKMASHKRRERMRREKRVEEIEYKLLFLE